MSPMNIYIEYSFALISADGVSAVTIGVKPGMYYSLDNKCLCGDWISITSCYVSMSMSHPRYISSPLIIF